MAWSPRSWRDFPIKQQPTYEDLELLKSVERELSSYPPLIFAGEARNLQRELKKVSRGETFIVQGGDCAESFDAFNADRIQRLFKLILQMSVVMMYSREKSVVRLGECRTVRKNHVSDY